MSANSFYQCTLCKTFVISSSNRDELRQQEHNNHSFKCLSRQQEVLGKFKDNPDIGRVEDEKHFTRVNFPEMIIQLSQVSAYSSSVQKIKPVITPRHGRTSKSKCKGRHSKTSSPAVPVPFMRKYRFNCSICPARFYTQSERDQHVNGIHNGPRKLISCFVCERIFNRRDSLNAHVTAHQTAEEIEEKFDIVNTWEKLQTYDPKNPFARQRVVCKYCLIVHTNHKSFMEHRNTEHLGVSPKFPCRYNNCEQEFNFIRELTKHAKASHPSEFYGKLTWRRMTHGIYVGNQVIPRDEFGNYIKKTNITRNRGPNLKKKAEQKKTKSTSTRKGTRRKLSEDSDESNDTDEYFDDSSSSTERLTGRGARYSERNIELERIHIIDCHKEGDNDGSNVQVKVEKSEYYDQQEVDPFRSSYSISNDDGEDREAKPILLAVKEESH